MQVVTREEQFEARVVEQVRRVLEGDRIEDDRFECKADWPRDHAKAARQIAGHANAARGEDIVWIFGLDEDGHTLSPLDDQLDPADWWQQVESSFDSPVPDLKRGSYLPINGGRVYAALLGTDARPYVVKNPEGGAFQRDVPWRRATRTDSATWADLLTMLQPTRLIPDVESYSADLEVRWQGTAEAFQAWAKAVLVFFPSTESLLLDTDVDGDVSLFHGYDDQEPFLTLHLPDISFETYGGDPALSTSGPFGTQLRITSTGLGIVKATGLTARIPPENDPFSILSQTARIRLRLDFTFAGSDRRVNTSFERLVPEKVPEGPRAVPGHQGFFLQRPG